jgi:hypothetical protein
VNQALKEAGISKSAKKMLLQELEQRKQLSFETMANEHVE